MLVPISSVSAEAFSVASSLSAHWYNPDRSGEGLVLEILSNDSALVYWFTYDEDGNQRWLIDYGDIDGQEIIFPTLTVTRGGRFGPNFKPEDVEPGVVGEAVFSFDSCNSGQWSFEAFGQSASYEVVRLTETMAANCHSPNGPPGWPIREYAGLSGSWYDPSHAGEGYTLQWMSRDEAVLIWFSYDPDGNQYWMIGTGTREGDQLAFPNLQTTTGGRFGDRFDSAQIEATDWGSLVLDLDCDEGTADYASILPEFKSGELSLSRLSFINDVGCPWTPPSIANIYSVSYEEIPLRGTSNVRPMDISNLGHVAAAQWIAGGLKVWTWSPGSLTVRELPGLRRSEPVLIRPDGLEIVAHDHSPYTPEGLAGGLPMVWNGNEWLEWPGRSENNTLVQGYSQDGSHTVGTVHVPIEGVSRSRAWRIDQSGLQEILPIGDGMLNSRGEAISEDGLTVVGDQITSDGLRPFRYSSIWVGQGEPAIIRDPSGTPLAYPAGCNSDCSIITGVFQGGELDLEHPNFGQAWLWVNGVGVKYLPRIDDAIESPSPLQAPNTQHVNSGLEVVPELSAWRILPTYAVQGITRNGSMIVGRYLHDVKGFRSSRAFLWTQATGMVTANELLQAAGVDEDGWFTMSQTAISPNGKYLLISGTRFGSNPGLEGSPRAAVLTLILK